MRQTIRTFNEHGTGIQNDNIIFPYVSVLDIRHFPLKSYERSAYQV